MALACDVTDPAAATAVGWRAAEALGGLDTVVYAPGTALLGPVSETSAEDWHAVLGTNLVGAALVARGALAPLRAAQDHRGAATMVFLSSHVVPRPPPGLVAYAASKAALDTLARGLREEEPWLRVLDVVVGNTLTGFADHWDREAASAAIGRWLTEGYLDERIFTPEQMAELTIRSIADGDGPLDVTAV